MAERMPKVIHQSLNRIVDEWEHESMETSTERRASTPVRLLVAAAPALLMVAIGTAVYPHVTAAGAPPELLLALRAAIGLCLAAVFLLPVAALVKRLVN